MNTDQRMVQLKTSVMLEANENRSVSRKELVHLNFMATGNVAPTAEDYGVQNDQHKAELNKFLKYMKSIDGPFFKWLEGDANNAILFANDPVKALKTALPDFDESVLHNLNKDFFI